MFGTHYNNRQPDGQVVTPEIIAAAATGRFEVTGSPSPAVAPDNAGFRVSSSAVSTDGDYLRITTGGGVVDNYEVEKGGGVTGGYHSIDATSANAVFWDDLRTTIASDLSSYTVAYSPTYDVHSIAISASAKLYRPIASQHLLLEILLEVAGPLASIYIMITGAAVLQQFQQFIWQRTQRVKKSTMSLEKAIEPCSLILDLMMLVAIHFRMNIKLTTLVRYGDQKRVHMVISHNGVFDTGGSATLYINGVSSSWGSTARRVGGGVPSGGLSVQQTTQIYLLNDDTGGSPTILPVDQLVQVYLDHIFRIPSKYRFY